MVTKSSGMAMVTIQAPWVNFVIRTMIKTMAVKVAPTALIACERRILGRELLGAAGQFALPVSDHSKLGEGEGHEDTNDVQLDDRADVGVEGHDQGDGKQSKQDDAVAVDEAVAAVVQLARQEAVGGKQEASSGKPLKAVLAAKIKWQQWPPGGSRRGDRSRRLSGRSARARFGWVCRRAAPGRWGSRPHGHRG